MTNAADGIIATGTVCDDARGIAIQWDARSHVLAFTAKEYTRQDDGRRMYYEDDGSVCNLPQFEFAKANRFISGFVKWDGCSDVTFGDGRGYLHLCGYREAQKVGWVIDQAFALAAEYVPSFDKEVSA